MKHLLKINPGKLRKICLLLLVLFVVDELQAQQTATNSSIEEFFNTSKSFENRAQSLVSLLSLEEKVSQLQHVSPAIPRFGIPAYAWLNE